MKKFIITGFIVALCALIGTPTKAQSPPGWGIVKHMSSYTSTTQFDNKVVGMGQDAAGNMYIAGDFAGNPTFDTTPAVCRGEIDIFVAKYSPAGTLLWLRKIQGTGVESLFGFGVAPNGRCLLSGSYSGMTGGDVSFENAPMLVGSRILGPGPNGLYDGLTFMASIGTNGTLEWSNSLYPSGAIFADFAFDNRGNCYCSGSSTANDEFNGQQYPLIGTLDALLAKINPATGSFEWVRRVGATGGASATATKLLVGASGALYWSFDANRTMTLDGITAPVSTIGGSCLVKLTPNNRVRWVRNDLVVVNQNVRAQQAPLAVDEAANAIYLPGSNPYNGTTVMFPGSTLPPFTVPVGSAGSFIAVCDTGGVRVTSVRPISLSTPIATNATASATGIVQLWATANTFAYVANIGGDSPITLLPDGRTGSINEGPVAVAQLDNAPSRLAWARKAGISGPNVWNNNTDVVGAVRNAAGNIWVAGNFQGRAVFGTTAITSASSTRADMFLAELDMAVITGTRPQTTGVAWSVFPNPAAGVATLAGLPAQAQVRVYDAQGRLVRTLGTVATATTPRTVADLAPGLYLLQVANTKEAYQLQRLVVE